MKAKIVILASLFVFLNSSFLILNSQSQWVKLQNFSEGQVYKILNYNNDILAGAYSVYKSTNLGENWTTYFQGTSAGTNALNTANGNIWVGNFYQTYYTTNNGANWTNANFTRYTYDFASINNRVFAGTESYKCYYTDNGGVNWGQCSDIWEDVKCFKANGSTLFAGTTQGIYYTTNSGINWVLTYPGYLTAYEIKLINGILFAATYDGIWNSTNNGANWNQLSTGSFKALESFNQHIFSGSSNNGFYVSTNNGLNWTQRNEGLINTSINSLAIAGNYIFAATNGDGIWKRPLTDIVGISQTGFEIPSTYSLQQNYPNPFNPVTKIRFSIPAVDSRLRGNDRVLLKVFNNLGKEVQTLVNQNLQPGTYQVSFNAEGLSSGVYFYRIETSNFTSTKKCVLIK
jgi:hypothetical protein